VFPNPVTALGVNMVIQQGAVFKLADMDKNLTLTGAANYIDVGAVGTLLLSQHIVRVADQNRLGGIGVGGARNAGAVGIKVELGGLLNRPNVGGPVGGVADQVGIAAPIYNLGGTVDVGAGESLNLTGTDTTGYSYWQTTAAGTGLLLEAAANIKAAGTYEIDIGTVTLTAPAAGTADELDGLGLNFAIVQGSTTALTIVDATPGTPGAVSVKGGVKLVANTTTTLNYDGANNKADLLDVASGQLQLAGTLNLLSNGSGKPNIAGGLTFLDDSDPNPVINGVFGSFTGDIPGAAYAIQVVPVNGKMVYKVTIT
jgi:hypothetical protein